MDGTDQAERDAGADSAQDRYWHEAQERPRDAEAFHTPLGRACGQRQKSTGVGRRKYLSLSLTRERWPVWRSIRPHLLASYITSMGRGDQGVPHPENNVRRDTSAAREQRTQKASPRRGRLGRARGSHVPATTPRNDPGQPAARDTSEARFEVADKRPREKGRRHEHCSQGGRP